MPLFDTNHSVTTQEPLRRSNEKPTFCIPLRLGGLASLRQFPTVSGLPSARRRPLLATTGYLGGESPPCGVILLTAGYDPTIPR